jgi:hypothetical protein
MRGASHLPLDDEEDGDWLAPTIPNPKCADVSGCGTWTRPMIKNPEYKGKWPRASRPRGRECSRAHPPASQRAEWPPHRGSRREAKKGSLLEDFNPPVNPEKEIDDPKDSKPADWVDDPNPRASRPRGRECSRAHPPASQRAEWRPHRGSRTSTLRRRLMIPRTLSLPIGSMRLRSLTPKPLSPRRELLHPSRRA